MLNDGSAGPTEDTVAESTVDGGRFTGGLDDLPPQLLMDELKREAAQGAKCYHYTDQNNNKNMFVFSTNNID